jgi:hypothetical protein
VAGNDEQRWTSVHRRGFAQVARAGADAEWHTRGVTVMHVRLLAARSVVPSLPRSLQCIHSSQTNSCGPSSFSRSPHTICTRWHHTRSGDSSAGWPFIASCDRECRGREKGLHALCRRPPFSAPCPSLRVCMGHLSVTVTLLTTHAVMRPCVASTGWSSNYDFAYIRVGTHCMSVQEQLKSCERHATF